MRESQNKAELHIAIYFQTFGIRISKFQKMLNKILEVAIDVHYKSVK
jgi:hypothetical protein